MDGTPCGDVIEHAEFVHHPDNLINIYPKDSLLKQLKAVSYMGVPLWDTEQRVLGHLAVLDTRPLAEASRTLKIFHGSGLVTTRQLFMIPAWTGLKN